MPNWVTIREARRKRRKRIKRAKTVFGVLLILSIVLAFIGVEPLASYKDNGFSWATEKWNAWEARAAPTEVTPAVAEDISQEIFTLINQLRIEHGEGELRWSASWTTRAQEHSELMAATGTFEHSAYNCNENIYRAYGIDDIPSGAISNWLTSPGHRDNLLDSQSDICGIGVAESKVWTYITFMAK